MRGALAVLIGPALGPLTSRLGGTSAPSRVRSAGREPLIAAPDRRRLVDDFAHRGRALFGSFQVLEDYRQRGGPAVLLNRESGTGNKARSHVDVLDLPDSPNHLIAPSSRPLRSSAPCCAAGAQSVASSGSQAVMPRIEAEVDVSCRSSRASRRTSLGCLRRQTSWAAFVADGMAVAASDWHRSRFSVNCDKIEFLFLMESEGRLDEIRLPGHPPAGSSSGR